MVILSEPLFKDKKGDPLIIFLKVTSEEGKKIGSVHKKKMEEFMNLHNRIADNAEKELEKSMKKVL